ncbi:MAG: NAD(P)(+) transhydrogenase (Re/Si-specific) subunit alpha, partial [gamma proteobacterium symbiont of Bathyaustriella thionipta]|nr:NAD(P)(+) transhydrogenase (Re/Si-specific) subunit alpha [gamma proteobacterium symbiont of Bathyaustriella thionipta]
RPAPRLISEEVVKNMRDGSVIIDMAAATGGDCPLTEADKVVVKHGVTLVGHTDYPSMVPSDASTFYDHNVTNLLAVLLESVDGKPTFKPFDEDDITQAVLMPKLAGED